MNPGGLADKTVVVTRERKHAKKTVAEIEKRGGRALLFPTIRIAPATNREDAARAIRQLELYDWMVFTSSNTVDCFDELFGAPSDALGGCRVAAIGDSTAEALRRRGIPVDLVPGKFSAKGLLEAFAAENIAGMRFLQPCSRIAREELPEGLKTLGAKVDRVVVYDTVPNDELDPDPIRRGLETNGIDCLTFFSPSAFDFFIKIVGTGALRLIRERNIPVAAIGPTTARAVEAGGISNVILPHMAGDESLLESIAAYFDTHG
jgi:uroporphyrinogen-III synthase